MLGRNQIVKKEQKVINEFLGKKSEDVPQLPSWITEELIRYWDENMFHIHWLPQITVDRNSNFPLWKQKPSEFFYKKIQKRDLKEEAKILSGKWILIDSRDKPSKKVPWITVNSSWFFKVIGISSKDYFKKWGKQKHSNEYLTKILERNGFGSRFCSTIQDIEELKSFTLNFLRIDSKKRIRLPFFMEYNYLGNAFYNQWGTTRTWEWHEDKLKDGQRLAGGYESVGCVGCDPPKHWSTILSFRFLIEL